MNEARDVAIFMANLDGMKNKSPMVSGMAPACMTLKTHPGWGIAEMSRYFGVAKPALKGLGQICYLEPEFLAMAAQKKLKYTPHTILSGSMGRDMPRLPHCLRVCAVRIFVLCFTS